MLLLASLRAQVLCAVHNIDVLQTNSGIGGTAGGTKEVGRLVRNTKSMIKFQKHNTVPSRHVRMTG